MRSELLQGIANIIGNYRSGELPRSLDKDHVDKWARQFSKESQEIILTETLHVLKNWYFTNDKVDEVVDRFIEFFREKYALASTNDNPMYYRWIPAHRKYSKPLPCGHSCQSVG